MLSYLWPLGLVVSSNVLYQICAKSVPEKVNPMASLTVTYLVGALFSAILYFTLNRDADILREYKNLNWAPFVLGLVIVGLEVGFIYAYKAGWQVSTLSVVQSAFLAVILLAVGYFAYREQLSVTKLCGVGVCLAGLWLINR